MRRLLPLLALLACDPPDEAPAAPPAVPVVTGTHSSPAAVATFAALAAPCCGDPASQAVVDAGINLAEALAADKAPEASAAWSALVAGTPALEAANPALAAPLRAAIDGAGVVAPGDLNALRAGLAATAEPLRAVAKTGGGAGQVVLAFCPMKPGRWLQRKDGIANPYYGAKMPTCGTFEAL